MRIGTGDYRLCGLDTNVFSELVKDPRTYLPGITRILGDSPSLLCFSPYTLFELRARPDLFARFVEIFDVYPCAILKNEEQLVEAEVDAYGQQAPVDPLLFGFSYLNRSRGTNLKNLLEVVFAHNTTAERERDWPALKLELLRDWIALRANYPPKGRTYVLTEAKEFARRVAIQQLEDRAPAFVARIRSKGERLDVSRFPSLRMMLLTLFFRVYEPLGRKPTPQDVFDVLIAAPTPYLDVVITENMQAAILGKARRVLSALRDVEVLTLRQVREPGA